MTEVPLRDRCLSILREFGPHSACVLAMVIQSTTHAVTRELVILESEGVVINRGPTHANGRDVYAWAG